MTIIIGEVEKIFIAEVIVQIAEWKLKKCSDYDAEFYMRNIEKAWKKYLKNKIEEIKKN